ncbi:MAG: hypothetical protein IKH26_01445 [Bacteroidaceae bacterium]|nr:hypothetical protein [Bacteroidaceae bacterium]
MRKIVLFTVVASATLLVSCVNDDLYDVNKVEKFASNFKEHFGEIDEGHTFNMVKAVNISANTSFSNFRLKVYDNTPNCGLGAHLLGDFKNLSGATEVKCDVPSYVNTLYFAYEHDGLTHYSTAEITPDNRSLAEMNLSGTRAGGTADKDVFLSTFSIFHQDQADRAAYPENPNITIPNNGNFDMTDLTADSDVPNKKWGVFSKAFYDFLEGTQGDGTYNGILPFNLFKHGEDHSAYASDFTFEYDADAADANGIDWITFYPFEYEAGRHDIVGYYIYSIATGAILEHHDVYENNYEVDQYRLVGADDDIHVNNDPNFLGVLTSDNNIDPYTVTGNAQNIIPFPSKYFNFDSYVDYYDKYENITKWRITDYYLNNIDHRSGNDNGLLSNDNGFTFTSNLCTKTGIISNGYEARADQPIQGNNNTYSILKNVRLGKGFFKVVGYAMYRNGTNDVQASNNTTYHNSYGYLRTNDVNNTGKVKQFSNLQATETALTWVKSVYDIAHNNYFPYGNGQYRPTRTNRDFGGFEDGVPDEHFSEFWFRKWKGLADAASSEAERDAIQNQYASVRYFSVEEDNTVVQIGFDGRFIRPDSWFTGRNIQLYKLAERQPRWNCKAVLGKPCTVGLREGQGLGFYIKTRTYWNITQPETGEAELMEGYGQDDPKIAEGNRRSAPLKSSDAETPGMITYYSESSRNPDETKQCVYASLNITDDEGPEVLEHEYGVIGLEDWGLNEETASDKDYNDIMLLIEHKVTNNKETPMVYTIAYEDLGTTDDFDFNDLVLQVSHATGSGKAVVKVKCAGGHLPIQLFFGYPGDTYYQEIWSSINRQAYGLGGTYIRDGNEYNADQVIINTNADTYAPALPLQYPNLNINFDPIKTINNVPDNFTISDDAREFNIVVTYDDDGHNGTQIRIAPNGKDGLEQRTPQAIVLDTDSWIWPKERANVDVAYPRISEWIRDKTQTEWLNHPVSGHIYEGTINKEERDTSN